MRMGWCRTAWCPPMGDSRHTKVAEKGDSMCCVRCLLLDRRDYPNTQRKTCTTRLFAGGGKLCLALCAKESPVDTSAPPHPHRKIHKQIAEVRKRVGRRRFATDREKMSKKHPQNCVPLLLVGGIGKRGTKVA